MILFLGERGDYSTRQVADWLSYSNIEFTRINADDTKDYNSIRLSNTSTNISFFQNKRIKSIWFRKGTLNYPLSKTTSAIKQASIRKAIARDISNEIGSYNHFNYHTILKTQKCLGSPFKYELPKLFCLDVAKRIGLSIPETLVTSSKTELIEFKKEHKQIILKAIQEIVTVQVNNIQYWNLTENVTDEFIKQLPDIFFPCLFQKQLDKKYELRVVFFVGACYTSAIMSQEDDKTKMDFRNYNYEKGNRNVAYNLPEIIKDRITTLMNKVGLNFGVLDIVVTKNMEYVFLEINPVGQYDAVSKSCNYFLDKKIAEYLSFN